MCGAKRVPINMFYNEGNRRLVTRDRVEASITDHLRDYAPNVE